MAQVESLNSSGTVGSIARPIQATLELEAKVEDITPPITIVTETPNFQIGREIRLTPAVKRESKATDDDEVQFVVSVPRRRKKRRKGQESSRHSIGPDSYAMAPVLVSAGNSSTADCQIPARQSTATRQFRPTILGSHENAHHPTSPQIQTQTMNGKCDHSSHRRMTAKPSYSTPTNSSGSPWTPWWNDIAVQQNSAPTVNWRPVILSDNLPPRQSYASSQEASAPTQFQFRQSEQISPRTNPALISTHTGQNTSGMSLGTNTSGTTTQNLSTTNLWPDLDWSMMESLNAQEYRPPLSAGPRPAQLQSTTNSWASPYKAWPAHPVQRYRSVYPPLSASKQSNSNQMLQGQFNCQSPIPAPVIDQYYSSQPPNFVQSTTAAIPFMRTVSNAASLVAAASADDIPTMSRSPSDIPLSQIRKRPSNAACLPPPAQSSTQLQAIQKADLLRKPSLYSIPPWSCSSGPSNVNVASITSTSRSPDTRAYSANGVIGTRRSDKVPSPSVGMQSGQASVHATDTSTTSTPVQSSLKPTSNPIGCQIPDVQLGRKHSPNLIVDIAESCQAHLPFAAIAERHSVPIQRVFDTFSAIVQLPLLRNVDDRRRHGSLGKQRMKEYRDAKKAMEKSQELERKRLMREMRGRVEEAGRRGRVSNGISSGGHGPGGTGNGGGLLREAILNNVRGNQGGAG